MIPDELARRIAVRDLATHDRARVLVEFQIDQPEPAQLLDLVRAVASVKIGGVAFTGVFTLLPAPEGADHAEP